MQTSRSPIPEVPRLPIASTTDQSDTELLETILSPVAGTDGVLQVLEQLRAHGGLAALASREPPALVREGQPSDVASVLSAVLELTRRVTRAELETRTPCCHPVAVARYVALHHLLPDQEIFGALYLDARHRLLHHQELFRGGIARCMVDVRPLLRHAILRCASEIVLFHTHPSGDPRPSPEDVAMTRRCVEAAALLGFEVCDHVIVGGPSRWVSLRERMDTLFRPPPNTF